MERAIILKASYVSCVLSAVTFGPLILTYSKFVYTLIAVAAWYYPNPTQISTAHGGAISGTGGEEGTGAE